MIGMKDTSDPELLDTILRERSITWEKLATALDQMDGYHKAAGKARQNAGNFNDVGGNLLNCSTV